jgi:hypothetical protein
MFSSTRSWCPRPATAIARTIHKITPNTERLWRQRFGESTQRRGMAFWRRTGIAMRRSVTADSRQLIETIYDALCRLREQSFDLSDERGRRERFGNESGIGAITDADMKSTRS